VGVIRVTTGTAREKVRRRRRGVGADGGRPVGSTGFVRGCAAVRWRYRPFQAAAIGLLAALVVACAVFTPIYDRAVRQAVARTAVARTDPALAGLRLTGTPSDSGAFGLPSEQRPMSPERVAATLPTGARASYGAPVLGFAASAVVAPGDSTDPVGEAVWRSGECDHVRLLSGTCPSRAGDVLVSAADRREFGYDAGTRLRVRAVPTATVIPRNRTIRVRVTGVYEQLPGAYWFGARLTGRAGVPDSVSGHVQHDVWLAARSTFEDPLPPLPIRSSTADYPLRADRVGVDEVLSLADTIGAMAKKGAVGASEGLVSVYSGMPTIAATVRDQSKQSRVTVPLLMSQLGLLLVVVLWLVLGAVTEQRRPEVALARLRGHGRRGAMALVLGELLPVVLLGAVPGVLLALLGSVAVRRGLLPGAVPFEVRLPAVAALALAVAVLVVMTVLATVRVTGEPVVALLRRVPARRSGWAIGAADAVVLTAAAAIAVVFAAGGIRGPVALVAPALVAVAVGLVLSHLIRPVAAAAGRSGMRRGRLRVATCFLDAARSPATRRVVVMVTLATALAVFSADALRIGQRNWSSAAEQQAGAPMVATVDGTDLADVRAALAGLLAADRDVTPVVRVRPPGEDGRTTLAVVPDEFRRIALFPGGAPPAALWRRLAPPPAEPVTVRGTTLTVSVSRSSLVSERVDGHATPVTLGVDLLTTAGETLHVTLGELRRPVPHARLAADIQCSSGCNLTGIWFGTLPGATIDGAVTLDRVAGSAPLRVGPASGWVPLDDPATGSIRPVSDRPGRLTLQVHGTGADTVTIHQAWIPGVLPALVGGSGSAGPATGSGGPALTLTGLDAQQQAGTRVAGLARVPASGPDTDVVDLDAAQRGRPLDTSASLQLWFGRDDPALLRTVEAALARHSVAVTKTTTLHHVRQDLGWTAPAWSLELAALVGGAALLIALLVLVVSAASSWRTRTRDLAALRMSGVPVRELRRLPVLAQLLAVVVGVVAGTATGLYGAHLALPMVPLFAVAPEVSTLDLATSWGAVAAAALVALLLLGTGGVLIGRRLGARAHLELLREVL
jgi:hypothetical protein